MNDFASSATPPVIESGRSLHAELWAQRDLLSEVTHEFRRELGFALPEPSLQLDVSLPSDGFRIDGIEQVAAGDKAIEVGRSLGAAVRRRASRYFDAVGYVELLAQLPADTSADFLRALALPEAALLLRTLLDENVPLVDFAAFAGPVARLDRRVVWHCEDGRRRAVAALSGYAAMAIPRPGDVAGQRLAVARAIAVPRLLQRRNLLDDPLPVWSLNLADVPPQSGLPDDSRWQHALFDQIEACADAGGVLLVQPPWREALWQRLKARFPSLLMASGHELPRAARLRVVAIRLPPTKASHDA